MKAEKVLVFDPFNGASGDMILGALIDLGVPLDHLQEELAKLPLEPYTLSAERIERQGLRAVNFRVQTKSGSGAASREHTASGHRHYSDIRQMLQESRLSTGVRERALQIFHRLAEAEAEVHGSPIEKVHFHEVGAIDSIVDVVGACIGFEYLDVGTFYSNRISLGGGMVKFSHGNWPVPAPATEKLVRGFPVRMGPVEFELTTPTGAAILTEIACFETPSTLTIEGSGLGAGDREPKEIPNVLRVFIGTVGNSAEDPEFDWQEEDVIVLEASIDNMDPESLADFQERALSAGALDVYYSSLHMKKGRPGVLLSILCSPGQRNQLAQLTFQETTTLGLRWIPMKRWVLARTSEEIECEYGKIRLKVARADGDIVNIWPEYEDLRKAASTHRVSLKRVRAAVARAVGSKYHE